MLMWTRAPQTHSRTSHWVGRDIEFKPREGCEKENKSWGVGGSKTFRRQSRNQTGAHREPAVPRAFSLCNLKPQRQRDIHTEIEAEGRRYREVERKTGREGENQRVSVIQGETERHRERCRDLKTERQRDTEREERERESGIAASDRQGDGEMGEEGE